MSSIRKTRSAADSAVLTDRFTLLSFLIGLVHRGQRRDEAEELSHRQRPGRDPAVRVDEESHDAER